MVGLFSGQARYRVAHGGRGSGKTRGFALMTAVMAYKFAEEGRSGVILCAREFMNSLADSSMEEIKQAIRSVDWLDDYFEIGETFIRTKNKRVWYAFTGLRTNLNSVKSKARILIAWVDEAEDVTEIAWQKLLPTVREDDSEIYVSYNPEKDGSPTDSRFRKAVPEGCKIIEMNYSDNPWFPDVLEQERQADLKRLDPNTYAWVWEGKYRENSKAQIFADKFCVEEFEPQDSWNGPYHGLDFGFSQDPSAAVKAWIDGRTLYIERESGGVGIENDELAKLLVKDIPGIEKHTVRADNARPETIAYLKKPDPYSSRPHLPQIVSCEKGKGSVEDGIEHIKSYDRVVIHPRCKRTIEEFRMYSYKVDRLTGDVLPIIVDAFNHWIDALRYALEPVMKRKKGFFG
jgi:phage terminase large subunit